MPCRFETHQGRSSLPRYASTMKMHLFGLFKNISRPTEVLIGILFVVPFFFLCKEYFTTGVTEQSIHYIIIYLPFLIVGMVILFPRSIKRDMAIYFLTFLMAGIACFIVGLRRIGDPEPMKILLIALGIFCTLFSYRYFRKIKPRSKKGWCITKRMHSAT